MIRSRNLGTYRYEGITDPWRSWTHQYSLVWRLGLDHLKQRYQSSSLGFLWSLLNPILMMLVYSFLFSIILRVEIPGVVYSAYFLTGYLLWNALIISINNNVNVISENRALLLTHRFPTWTLPASRVVSSFLNYGLNLIVLLLFNAVLGSPPGVELLALPVTILLGLMLALGLGFMVAAWTPFFRDLGQLIEIVLIVGYFSAPILYPYSMASENMSGWALMLYDLNPLVGLMGLLHWNFLGMPPLFIPTLTCVIGCPLVFVVGALMFRANKSDFTYVL
jgi:ABC-type polysaccharide/polyol phosphate export permease